MMPLIRILSLSLVVPVMLGEKEVSSAVSARMTGAKKSSRQFKSPFSRSVWPTSTPAGLSGEIGASLYSHILVMPDTHGDSEGIIRSLWLGLTSVAPKATSTTTYAVFRDTLLLAGRNKKFPKIPFHPDGDRVLLIQLGDIIDRGPYTVDCIGLILSIPRTIGWDLRVLFGNHDHLSMTTMYNEFVHWRELELLAPVGGRWGAFRYPKGFLYKSLLNNMLGVVRVSTGVVGGGILFVHGGVQLDWVRRVVEVAPQLLAKGLLGANATVVDKINAVIHQWVSEFDFPGTNLLLNHDSILWDRSLARDDELSLCGDQLGQVLDFFSVSQIFVGHTPQDSRRVTERCGGKIVLTDVAMSRWMFTEPPPESAMAGGQPLSIVITTGGTKPNGEKVNLSGKVIYSNLDGTGWFQKPLTVITHRDATCGGPYPAKGGLGGTCRDESHSLVENTVR